MLRFAVLHNFPKIRIDKRVVSFCVFTIHLIVHRVGALEIVQTFNQSNTNTTWNVPVALNQFDSSQGTLTEVRIAMSTTWSGSGQITNNSGGPGI